MLMGCKEWPVGGWISYASWEGSGICWVMFINHLKSWPRYILVVIAYIGGKKVKLWSLFFPEFWHKMKIMNYPMVCVPFYSIFYFILIFYSLICIYLLIYWLIEYIEDDPVSEMPLDQKWTRMKRKCEKEKKNWRHEI